MKQKGDNFFIKIYFFQIEFYFLLVWVFFYS
ncbi:MAG: hypothetical protein MRERC_2c101 [Mycoplasmataceae bacterium RC_NB112A]|nr:MAG: hypothetical protein MRERC_2c101 [Mycoplasmataceae bacterium RC_NB112A]